MHDEPNTPSPEESLFARRIGGVVLAFVLFLAGLVAMLFHIQIIEGGGYRDKAARQYLREVTSVASRGDILDRRGRMLAESIESVSFYADPRIVRRTPLRNGKGGRKTFDNSSHIAALCARHLGGSRQSYLKELRKSRGMAVLGRKIPIAKAMELMNEKIPGFWYDREHQRYYLNVAAQLIGVTNSSNHGISGIELQLDRELRGRNGTTVYQRTATGAKFPAPDARQQAALKGKTVELTIDGDIQSVVEDELAKIVTKYNAAAATGIVMEVKTGEILAMANSPTFNLNNRSTWTGEKARNRSVTDIFEPGSTFKIVMAAAATDELGRKAEDRVFAENGALSIYNRTVTDHEPYGDISFREAIMYSSNVVAAKTAMEVGGKKFSEYIHRFGFGSKTGVGLIGELSGKVKPMKEWSGTTLPWMGYGYEVMTTPLQILQAYAAVANGGEMMRPMIVRRVREADGRVVRESRPEVVRRVLSRRSADYLSREYFRAVVDSGTAVSATIRGISVAGKTGTAQRVTDGSYRNRVYVSSFVGYFPVEAPRYAIIVLVEDPKPAYYASTVAAPSFSSIASRMIACSGELQKNLSMHSVEQEKLRSITTVAVPELAGLSVADAKRLLRWLGLRMDISGGRKGFVVAQSIAPGSRVEKKRTIQVTIADQDMERRTL
ncbi:MAG: transpeptidase family protein [Chlorobium sp.]|nr:transpeptidase family protein [Chlorobium sp.]